jgi:hypothetical protein
VEGRRFSRDCSKSLTTSLIPQASARYETTLPGIDQKSSVGIGSCAAIFGWLLSGIPARKKRIYIDSSSEKPVKGRDKGLLRKLWREVWKFSKPMIAAYLAKLLAENAKSPQRK